MTTESPRTRLEVAVDLVKALVWPFMLLLVLVIFWRPLHQIAAALPSIVERSESIDIGALSIKVRHGRLDSPPAEVEEALTKLDPAKIPDLLNFRHPTCYVPKDFQWAQNAYAELLDLELLEATDDLSLCTQQHGAPAYTHVIRPTQLGTRTQNFLFDLLRQLSA